MYLRICWLDDNIVEMYFVDGQGSRIDVPVGLVVETSMTSAKVRLYSTMQTFALVWSESYVVYTKYGIIAQFSNQRQWSVSFSEPLALVSSDVTQNSR